MAEKTNAFSASDNKACSDGRSRTNERGNSERTRIRDGGAY